MFGDFKVAHTLADGTSAYAWVQVKLRENYLGKIQIIDSGNQGEWKTAVDFGVNVAWDLMKNPSGLNGVDVIIESIHGHTIDTTNVVMAYAACMAILKAVNIAPKTMPSMNVNSLEFTFPK
ncbi:hypothetical protein [Acanthopleuribacter pedis]|uniref:Uncharacterized protein n=1 Tax=Acanthopleuribacter pedis TaxID=442870 RepID=A0A8J7QFM7_9BACT|nr:hypothetical protein [Acanthopleuribacter pedis]MBO1323224.1 hypothetical protein [Acanthopleuribacter pedis]